MSRLVRREHGTLITQATPGKRMAEAYETGMAFYHERFGTYFVPTARQKNGGVKGILYSPDVDRSIKTSVQQMHFEHWKLVAGVPRHVANKVVPGWPMIVNESFLKRRRWGR